MEMCFVIWKLYMIMRWSGIKSVVFVKYASKNLFASCPQHNPLKTVFDYISKHREESLDTTRNGIFLISVEVFGNVIKSDMFSQSKLKLRTKRETRITPCRNLCILPEQYFLMALLCHSLALVCMTWHCLCWQWLQEEYKRANEEDPMSAPYHYGCHYSNSGTVLHFLVRLPPFTKMFLQYQGMRRNENNI